MKRVAAGVKLGEVSLVCGYEPLPTPGTDPSASISFCFPLPIYLIIRFSPILDIHSSFPKISNSNQKPILQPSSPTFTDNSSEEVLRLD